MKKLILIFLMLFLSFGLISCKKKNPDIEQMIKEYRDAKIKLYISENNEYDDYEVDVAFLGDSLTDGYDVKSYYPDYLVVNRGIGGDTTFDLENRLQVSLYDLKPKVIVMLIGANNFKTMFDNYENILKGFQQNVPNSKVILLSLTSMGKEWGKNNNIAKENNIKIQELATKYNYEFIDLYNPLLNLTTNEIYEEYTTDGGHLTPKGYEVLTKCITPIIKQQLDNYHLENE